MLQSRARSGALLLLLLLLTGCSTARDLPLRVATVRSHPDAGTASSSASSRARWPETGQASLDLDGRILDSPDQRPVPIASVAKVMTAYVVVQQLPAGARLVVGATDVADTLRRRARGESVLPVEAGEVLTRDQALTALLLPSANNVAAMLARRVSGHWPPFLHLMNQTAHELGMHHTTYTDPSGYQPSTTSTAHDQLLLLRAALQSPTLARVMALPSAYLPVAGLVRSTNRLLGQDGFVAGKTGSTSAAGGCLVFRAIRSGHVVDGAVLGQRGPSLIEAGLAAASRLVGQVLSHERARAGTERGMPALPPG